MPEARGDIREIVGQPVFVPLYKLYLAYGGVFRLSFGPKTFVIVSDRDVAKQILVTNAAQYSKGILSEILDFVMGQVDSHAPCSQAPHNLARFALCSMPMPSSSWTVVPLLQIYHSADAIS